MLLEPLLVPTCDGVGGGAMDGPCVVLRKVEDVVDVVMLMEDVGELMVGTDEVWMGDEPLSCCTPSLGLLIETLDAASLAGGPLMLLNRLCTFRLADTTGFGGRVAMPPGYTFLLPWSRGRASMLVIDILGAGGRILAAFIREAFGGLPRRGRVGMIGCGILFPCMLGLVPRICFNPQSFKPFTTGCDA